MKNLYQVFNINISFDLYGLHNVLVGAIDIDDLIKHIKDVFPDYITEIEEDELEYYPGKKVGDKIIEPYFTDEQFEDICKIDNNPIFNRIQLIKNLYTDKPYTILDGCSYIE